MILYKLIFTIIIICYLHYTNTKRKNYMYSVL